MKIDTSEAEGRIAFNRMGESNSSVSAFRSRPSIYVCRKIDKS